MNPNSEIPWTIETMRLINALTPDVKEKAFDPDWFLLRQRFEAIENELSELKSTNESLHSLMVSAEKRGMDKAKGELATVLDANRRANAAIGDIANECAVERAARDRAEKNNWTASLCDRVNEFLREHRVCDEVKNGQECSLAIQTLHGYAGSLKSELEKYKFKGNITE